MAWTGNECGKKTRVIENLKETVLITGYDRSENWRMLNISTVWVA
jgi:hypothetical protein